VRRAQRIGQFLEKDIDNDGNVTRAELREVLGLEASRPMAAASGVSVEPTREQAEAIVSRLLAKTLLADTNGDGKINFAEMRQQADDDLLQGWGRVTQLDLQDAVLIRALDTSSDQMISLAEFVESAKKILVMMDANKDGRVSFLEAEPFSRMKNTF